MRRLIILIFASIMFFGCQEHEAELVFDGLPEERMAQKLQELQERLVESPSGWKATLNTGTSTSKGAYNFYIDFDNGSVCKMQGDLTPTSSSTWGTSTYRVVWSMNASLVFDTFNYITMLQEPSSAFGGTAPHGYRSDIEFEYIRSTPDSVFLKGKKYQHDLVLTKISTTDVASLDEGKLKTKIDEVTSFFAKNLNSYFEIGNDGIKYAVSVDRIARAIIINWIEGDKVNSVQSSFAYSLEGVDIFKPIDLKGNILTKIEFTGNTAKMISLSGSYDLKNNPIPILPINSLFAHNGAFNALVIEGAAMPVGIVSEFNSLWAAQLSNYVLNNVTMVSFIFKLNNSNTASLLVRFNSGGTVYLAQADYNYTLIDGILKLSVPISTNGNYNNGWVITNIKNYFSGAEFKLGYSSSTNPDVVNIGGLYKTNNAASFFYGKLAKN